MTALLWALVTGFRVWRNTETEEERVKMERRAARLEELLTIIDRKDEQIENWCRLAKERGRIISDFRRAVLSGLDRLDDETARKLAEILNYEEPISPDE